MRVLTVWAVGREGCAVAGCMGLGIRELDQ